MIPDQPTEDEAKAAVQELPDYHTRVIMQALSRPTDKKFGIKPIFIDYSQLIGDPHDP
jgi:hypothetical protein